mgnify:CR=1 FL=1
MPSKPGREPEEVSLKPIEWNKTMSVGIDVLDNQHKRIAVYINELEQAHSKNDRDTVSEAIFNLMEYVELHFNAEETLMEEAGYPMFDSHKQVHQSFASRLTRYYERHENREDIAQKLLSELSVWWVTHIGTNDLDYAPYLKKLSKRDWINHLVKQNKV